MSSKPQSINYEQLADRILAGDRLIQRSPAYRQGLTAMLIRKGTGRPVQTIFDEGTAEYDAFLAGARHASELVQQAELGLLDASLCVPLRQLTTAS